jgi:hypothetical protein
LRIFSVRSTTTFHGAETCRPMNADVGFAFSGDSKTLFKLFAKK